MEFFFFWLIMGGVVALIANSKGRNPVGWFFYGALIWPIALTHILVSSGAQPPTADRGSTSALPPLFLRHNGKEIIINRADNTATVDGLHFASPEAARDYIDRRA